MKGTERPHGERGKPRDRVKRFYYRDENEDFLTIDGKCPTVGGGYRYIRRGFFSKVLYFVLYRLIATPAAFLYTKLKFGERYVGKKALREYLKASSCGAFLVGNHTQPIADAFTPNLVSFPRRNFTVIHPSNLNMPIVGRALPYLGGLPTPTDVSGALGFSRAAMECIKTGYTVTLYPEAHLWPYYTGVREFERSAFHLAAKLSAPVFSFTRVYEKRLFRIGCRVYVDGPFYPDGTLPRREAAEKLCREVQWVMKKRAECSCATGYEYIKEE